jgi:hypothetical protein
MSDSSAKSLLVLSAFLAFFGEILLSPEASALLLSLAGLLALLCVCLDRARGRRAIGMVLLAGVILLAIPLIHQGALSLNHYRMMSAPSKGP